MAATGASLFPASFSPVFRRDSTSSSVGKFKSNKISISSWRLAVSTEQAPTIATANTTTRSTSRVSDKGRLEKLDDAEAVAAAATPYEEEVERGSLREYFERSKELIIRSDGGPPRWFTPLECGPPLTNSPLLFFLPGLSVSLSSLLVSVVRYYILAKFSLPSTLSGERIIFLGKTFSKIFFLGVASRIHFSFKAKAETFEGLGISAFHQCD